MHSFSEKFINSLQFNPATTWFVSQCTKAQGMQEMWNTTKPEILNKLRESAIIQSTESSNRIEGVEIDNKRLLPLVSGKSKPRDRPEEEIVGYRRALNFIHKQYKKTEISPETIKKLHELAQGGMIGDAGKWKERNNEIMEFLPNGERIIRFKPVAPSKVSKYIEQLCLGYQDTTNNDQMPELISISNFVFDFLCIHPFRDGNGRVSRLLTLLLLYKHGYEVGRYISLERIIEDTKGDYYEALKKSSDGWFATKHDMIPWWHHFLGTIKVAYQELKTRVEMSNDGDTASSLIRQTIGTLQHQFSISDICKIHPSIDRELVKKVVFALKKEGSLALIGNGRGAKWAKK